MTPTVHVAPISENGKIGHAKGMFGNYFLVFYSKDIKKTLFDNQEVFSISLFKKRK